MQSGCPVYPDLVAHRYGSIHQSARTRAVAMLQDGDPCARCASRGMYHPLTRDMGRLLHLDHDDEDGGYLGLSFAKCNMAAGGAKGRAIQLAARPPKLPPLRPCCECGVPFSPSRPETITCGRLECVTKLRASRRRWEPDPGPPVVAAPGRRW
jgi:hypothetical protein